MNKYFKASLLLGLFLTSNSYALHPPVQGLYGGILAGISHGPTNSRFEFYNPSITYGNVNIPLNALTTYDQVGGGGGAMLGYKFQHLRIEGEFLYNRISTGPLRSIDGCPLNNVGITPYNTCIRINDQDAGFKGSNPATFGFVNAYYDFFNLDTDYNIVPFLGLGIGKGRIKSLSNIVTVTPYFNDIGILEAPQFYFDASANTTAAQGILGVSYYMDDYAWISLDYRYIATRKFTYKYSTLFATTLSQNSYTLNTLNVTVNFAFDVGGINC